jgi:hypothetical protein
MANGHGVDRPKQPCGKLNSIQINLFGLQWQDDTKWIEHN